MRIKIQFKKLAYNLSHQIHYPNRKKTLAFDLAHEILLQKRNKKIAAKIWNPLKPLEIAGNVWKSMQIISNNIASHTLIDIDINAHRYENVKAFKISFFEFVTIRINRKQWWYCFIFSGFWSILCQPVSAILFFNTNSKEQSVSTKKARKANFEYFTIKTSR